eukprot:scaffold28245_cov19-Tisochrysis_lutea.AAC.2
MSRGASCVGGASIFCNCREATASCVKTVAVSSSCRPSSLWVLDLIRLAASGRSGGRSWSVR